MLTKVLLTFIIIIIIITIILIIINKTPKKNKPHNNIITPETKDNITDDNILEIKELISSLEKIEKKDQNHDYGLNNNKE